MLEQFIYDLAWHTGLILDLLGVGIILLGLIISTVHAARILRPGHDTRAWFRRYRHNMARSLLVGLEFLLAGDIIRTVAGGRFDMEQIGVLAVIIVVRIILGISLEAELSGKWPEWRHLFRRPKKPPVKK